MGASKSKDSKKALGPQVVTDLLSVVKAPRNHTRFFDNIFTSYHLLRDLHEEESKATGTIRENQILKCPFRSSKFVARKDRDFYYSRSDEFVRIVQWKDNKVVYMQLTITKLNQQNRENVIVSKQIRG